MAPCLINYGQTDEVPQTVLGWPGRLLFNTLESCREVFLLPPVVARFQDLSEGRQKLTKVDGGGRFGRARWARHSELYEFDCEPLITS